MGQGIVDKKYMLFLHRFYPSAKVATSEETETGKAKKPPKIRGLFLYIIHETGLVFYFMLYINYNLIEDCNKEGTYRINTNGNTKLIGMWIILYNLIERINGHTTNNKTDTLIKPESNEYTSTSKTN